MQNQQSSATPSISDLLAALSSAAGGIQQQQQQLPSQYMSAPPQPQYQPYQNAASLNLNAALAMPMSTDLLNQVRNEYQRTAGVTPAYSGLPTANPISSQNFLPQPTQQYGQQYGLQTQPAQPYNLQSQQQTPSAASILSALSDILGAQKNQNMGQMAYPQSASDGYGLDGSLLTGGFPNSSFLGQSTPSSLPTTASQTQNVGRPWQPPGAKISELEVGDISEVDGLDYNRDDEFAHEHAEGESDDVVDHDGVDDDIPPLPAPLSNSEPIPPILPIPPAAVTTSTPAVPTSGPISPAVLLHVARLGEEGKVFPILKELQEAQTAQEDNLLEQRQAVIDKHENGALAMDILGGTPEEFKQRESQLKEELRKIDMIILNKMDHLRRKQQDTLEKIGVPLFSVTDDPEAIKTQQKVLSLLSSMMPAELT